MLTHGEDSNEIYIRECPELEGKAFQGLVHAFPKAIVIGVLRPDGEIRKPILNPPEGFKIAPNDLLVFVAQHYEHTQSANDYAQIPLRRGVQPPTIEAKRKRRILLLGWNDRVPALVHELDSYENESFDIDILSTIPIHQRENRMARYALHPHRVILKHMEGDYSAPLDLRKIQAEQYDNVVILGCDWLESKEEADARTILGYLLLRQIFAESEEAPEVLVELLDPQNHEILRVEEDEVLISPMILSHILAHVALRPGLNAVFQELFSSGGAEIFFRQAEYYKLTERVLTFREIQETVFQKGEIAIGVRIPANSTSTPGGVELNPDREKRWKLGAKDEVVVLTTYA
jgi:hypothetical protein